MFNFIITELKSLGSLVWKSIKSMIVAAIIFLTVWVGYKFLPEGGDVLKIILNASGFAGAAAILGVFYNKTKNEVERPKVSLNGSKIPEKFKRAIEEALKKTSAKEALNCFVKAYKNYLEDFFVDKYDIRFSESISEHKENIFNLHPNELMLQSYHSECHQIFKDLELSSDFYIAPSPLHIIDQRLTVKYPSTDPAAENKICLDVYVCKNGQKDKSGMEIHGYAIVSAYYNTEMLVSCWILHKRSAENVERLLTRQ
jgi:hypothetical protein